MAMMRTCITCGTRYEYCGNCKGQAKGPTWKNIYDKESCKIIFNTLASFKNGTLTAEQTHDIVLRCKDVDLTKLTPQLQENWNEVMDSLKPKKIEKTESVRSYTARRRRLKNNEENLIVNED